MPLADYAHWNEEAGRVWWEEEGRHPYNELVVDEEPILSDAADAFAEDCAEWETEALWRMLHDEDYQARWPKTRPIIEWELRERGEDV